MWQTASAMIVGLDEIDVTNIYDAVIRRSNKDRTSTSGEVFALILLILINCLVNCGSNSTAVPDGMLSAHFF
jgi:hypothetical protein